VLGLTEIERPAFDFPGAGSRSATASAWAQLYLTDPDGNVIELNAERTASAS
jgi:catechol-2,3-dioxygenase